MRVATWNLKNLFRPGEEAGAGTQAQYEAKLAASADTIGRIAPDVLAVQEVGSPRALSDLVDRLEGGWSTELADPDRRGIRVGLLSRLPLSQVEQTNEFLEPSSISGARLRCAPTAPGPEPPSSSSSRSSSVRTRLRRRTGGRSETASPIEASPGACGVRLTL